MTESITTKPKTIKASESSYFIQINGLRTIAISAVMFGHWTLILPSFERAAKFAAFAGVDLFFVISGFLITGIQKKYKNDVVYSNGHLLRQFYIRRFLRIFPLYYLVVFAGLIVRMPGARENAEWLLSYTANFPPMLVGTNMYSV